MPTRDTTPAGAPCWIDLMTSDPAASKAFYGALFGWTSEDSGPEFGNYVTFAKDGALVCLVHLLVVVRVDATHVLCQERDVEALAETHYLAPLSHVALALSTTRSSRSGLE